ncbi:MAG: HD-GYP domain-containing protein [Bdellovibrionales bacterium]|nr:HD-GYP domain-containing protein [Bdellovibrionales bacterium]
MSWDDIPDWSKQVANSLLVSVKEKDLHTFQHCCRVGRRARQLGKALGLNEFEQAVLEYSGLFHDVGKVGIPDQILLKPGRLDTSEIEVMKSHPLKSVSIIEPLSHNAFFRFIMPGIRYHHERMDGLGYPHGLSGENIPLNARIITVVDTFDAMTNARSYRKAIPLEKVELELKNFSGTQFDAQLVKTFLELLPHLHNEKTQHQESKEEVVVSHILKAA